MHDIFCKCSSIVISSQKYQILLSKINEIQNFISEQSSMVVYYS